jgi:hypothetical protein
MAVGLYNSDSVVRNISTDISAVWRGFDPSAPPYRVNAATTAFVRDVWQRKDLGVFNGTFTAEAIGAHDTRVLKFSRPKPT